VKKYIILTLLLAATAYGARTKVKSLSQDSSGNLVPSGAGGQPYAVGTVVSAEDTSNSVMASGGDVRMSLTLPFAGTWFCSFVSSVNNGAGATLQVFMTSRMRRNSINITATHLHVEAPNLSGGDGIDRWGHSGQTVVDADAGDTMDVTFTNDNGNVALHQFGTHTCVSVVRG
jgi:hypothetical protein